MSLYLFHPVIRFVLGSGSFISEPTMPMADLSTSITWCLADASPSSLRADQLWPLSLLVRMHYAGGGCCSVRMNLINLSVLGLLIHIHHFVYWAVMKTWSAWVITLTFLITDLWNKSKMTQCTRVTQPTWNVCCWFRAYKQRSCKDESASFIAGPIWHWLYQKCLSWLRLPRMCTPGNQPVDHTNLSTQGRWVLNSYCLRWAQFSLEMEHAINTRWLAIPNWGCSHLPQSLSS